MIASAYLASATPFVVRMRAGVGRYAFGICLALLMEGLLLLALLSLSPGKQVGQKESWITVLHFKGDQPAPSQRAERQC